MDEKLVDFEANFSVLDRYGVDVTADTFITNPAIGRDNQIKELMLILLTPEKSAILIGKPGIGKTAIVEGLAYRMQRGEVPDALKGYTIINIKTASLLGTMPSGESKVQKMIDELKTREKIILFVDEIHMLIGATDSSSLDFANIFKEGLGRGSIKVIGATTTEEYERYIFRDKAFTRRFQKVEVPEPTREETIQIMMGTYPKFEKQTGRKLKYTSFIQERIMAFLVDITSEYKRVYALGSRYPDVCLTLLKQAFSYTVFDNREYVDIFDIRKAIENSKNIYPDVIKKELPRFDSEFNDLILEEKGEKTVEEWRREDGPTRHEQMTNSIIVDTSSGNRNGEFNNANSIFKNLENAPTMVDKQQLREKQPVKAILSEKTLQKFAKIGPTAISKGMKEKFNRKSDSSNIDNLLLSSKIGVISNNDSSDNLPFKYTVTDELKPGGTNDLLLGAPISSTLDGMTPKDEVVEIYKSDNLLDKALDPNKNSLILNDVRNHDEKRHSNSNLLNTGSSSFDKPLDFGNSNRYSGNSNQRNSNNSSKSSFFDTSRYIENSSPNNNYVNGSSNMNNSGNLNNDSNSNDNFNDNRNNDYNMSNNRNNFDRVDFSGINMNSSNNRSNNDSGNIQSNSNDQMFNDFNTKNSSMSLPSINGNNFLGNFSSQKGETLFGAPMYSPQEEPIKSNNDTLFGAPMYSSNESNGSNVNSLFGSTQNDFSSSNLGNMDISSDDNSGNSGETLFGAPMYSSQNENMVENNETVNSGVDIFGQLITNNMRIKDGKIVDEFSGLDKHGLNVKPVISEVTNVEPSGNVISDFGLNSGMFQNNFNGFQSNEFNLVDNNYPKEESPMKKWKFIQESEEKSVQKPTRFNELKLSGNNNYDNQNQSFNNKQVNMNQNSSSNFINFNDLNAGKIPQNEVNKFISLAKPEPPKSTTNTSLEDFMKDEEKKTKPTVNLTLEDNQQNDFDNYFDDFFEN